MWATPDADCRHVGHAPSPCRHSRCPVLATAAKVEGGTPFIRVSRAASRPCRTRSEPCTAFRRPGSLHPLHLHSHLSARLLEFARVLAKGDVHSIDLLLVA